MFRAKPHMVEEWGRLIPRDNFTPKAAVCDLHFEDRYLVKTFDHVVKGEKVVIERTVWKLVDDAVPTLFPKCQAVLQMKTTPSKRKQQSCLTTKRKRLKLSFEAPAADEADHGGTSTEPLYERTGQTLTQSSTCVEGLTINNVATELSSIKLQQMITKGQIHSLQNQVTILQAKMKCLMSKNTGNIRKIGRTKKTCKTTKPCLTYKVPLISDDQMNKLPEQAQLIFRHSIQLHECKDIRQMRYSLNWLLDCLLLKIRSPSGYEFLRKNEFLPLPCRTTLSKSIHDIDASFGFDVALFGHLREKLSGIPEKERLGILMWAEISLQEEVEYNKWTKHFMGFTDYGKFYSKKKQPIEGDHALVFLFKPHLSWWSQTIGTFYSKGATPETTLAKMVLHAIICLEKSGARVTSTVCDGASTNKAALQALGITGSLHCKKNTFQNPFDIKRNVFVFIDVPYIYKFLRNQLLKQREFKIPSGSVQMKHFEVLLETEKQLATGLRVVPKLQDAHISPNNFQKMSVRLAVQLFSSSTANGILFYKERGIKELRDANSTISFVKKMDRLFDALNRRHHNDRITKNSEDLRVIEEAVKWIDEWESFVSCLKEPVKRQTFLDSQTIESFRLTLNSMNELTKELLTTYGFAYVLTGCFNRDPLERFFGMIHEDSRSDTNPTKVHFMYLYRLMSVHSMVRPLKRSSTEYEKSTILAMMRQAVATKNKGPFFRKMEHQLDGLIMNPIIVVAAEEQFAGVGDNSYCDIETRECMVNFLGGYVARRMIDGKCDGCIDAIVDLNDKATRLQSLTNITTKGSLVFPSAQLMHLLEFIEDVIHTYLSRVSKTIYSDITESVILDHRLLATQVGCGNTKHKICLTTKIIRFYVACRLHFYTREKMHYYHLRRDQKHTGN